VVGFTKNMNGSPTAFPEPPAGHDADTCVRSFWQIPGLAVPFAVPKLNTLKPQEVPPVALKHRAAVSLDARFLIPREAQNVGVKLLQFVVGGTSGKQVIIWPAEVVTMVTTAARIDNMRVRKTI